MHTHFKKARAHTIKTSGGITGDAKMPVLAQAGGADIHATTQRKRVARVSQTHFCLLTQGSWGRGAQPQSNKKNYQ